MTASGEGNDFALRVAELKKSTEACNQLMEIALAVSALSDELKKEGLELCKHHAAYTAPAMIFVNLFMIRFSQYVPIYMAIDSKFKTVLTRINALNNSISECEQKHFDRLEAWIHSMPQFLTMEMVFNMTVDDHKERIKQLEEHRQKFVEVKTCMENALTDWNNAKEGVYNDLHDCTHRIDFLCEYLFQLWMQQQ